MGSAARTVRRLRLRAPSEAAVRRTVRVLEDALRTATLPDAGGRMLFVRRLALGRLPADADPVRVARVVEEAVVRTGVEWRHGDDAGAEAAAVVWFRDPLEAHAALARRLLAGHPARAWYWPLAAPSWNGGLTRGEGVRAIAHALAGRAEAPAALPRWFAELFQAGYGSALSAALRPEDVEPLARAAGVRAGEGTVVPGWGGVPGEHTDSAVAGPEADGVRRLIGAMLRMGGADGVPHSSAPYASSPPRNPTGPRSTRARGGPGFDPPASHGSGGPRGRSPVVRLQADPQQ